MIMRVRFATGSLQEGDEAGGGQPASRTEKSRISMMPSQKLGTERPQSERPLAR